MPRRRRGRDRPSVAPILAMGRDSGLSAVPKTFSNQGCHVRVGSFPLAGLFLPTESGDGEPESLKKSK